MYGRVTCSRRLNQSYSCKDLLLKTAAQKRILQLIASLQRLVHQEVSLSQACHCKSAASHQHTPESETRSQGWQKNAEACGLECGLKILQSVLNDTLLIPLGQLRFRWTLYVYFVYLFTLLSIASTF